MPNKYGKTYFVTEQDCRNAFAQISACAFVKDNPTYREVFECTYLHVSPEENVNASCGHLNDEAREYLAKVIPGIRWDKYTNILWIQAGILRWVTMTATVCEYLDRTKKIATAYKMMMWATKRLTRFCAGSDFVARFTDEFKVECDGRREEIVRIYASAILVGLLGHEMGRACLGHTGYRFGVNSCSRNNERCADMFASSVTQSIGSGYVGAIGTVMLMVSLMWIASRFSDYMTNKDLKAHKREIYAEHPPTIDRVECMIDSFNAVLNTSPITAKMLLKLARKA